MSDIDTLIADMRAGREGVTPAGWVYEFHGFGDVWFRWFTFNNPDGTAKPPTKHHGAEIRNIKTFYHFAPGNIARLLDEIKALRTQLATALDRETATTARYDALIAKLEAENARLSAGPTEDELDTAHSEGYEEGYSEGQSDAKSAHADLWSMLLGHLKKHDCEPASDDGNGHNAHQVMDAVFEREANIRADGKRLAEAENARLRAALRGFMDRQPVLDVLADGDDFPDAYVISVGCTLGDFRRAREALKESK